MGYQLSESGFSGFKDFQDYISLLRESLSKIVFSPQWSAIRNKQLKIHLFIVDPTITKVWTILIRFLSDFQSLCDFSQDS